MERTYEYYRDVLAGEPLPLAFIDLPLLDRNIKAVVARAKGKPIRLASGEIRCVPVLEHILDTSPELDGILAASVHEAVFLSRQGLDNILVAHPEWRNLDVSGICDELDRGKRIVCMADCIEHVHHLDELARDFDSEIPVCVEVDMAMRFLGKRYGGIGPALSGLDETVDLCRAVVAAPHLSLAGLRLFESPIEDACACGTANPVARALTRFLLPRWSRTIRARRSALAAAVRQACGDIAIVTGGSTATLAFSADDPALTEIAAGSAFFAPAKCGTRTGCPYAPAAAVALEIIRKPAPNAFVCCSDGYTSLGRFASTSPFVSHLPEGVRLVCKGRVAGAHIAFESRDNVPLGIGDPVMFRPWSAALLGERFNSLYLLGEGKILDQVPTYRGEGMCFI